MRINLINIEDNSFKSQMDEMIEMSYSLQHIKKDAYFIDWLPNNKNILDICKSVQDDVPIIIFDRYCSISDSEFLWLNDRNTVLMEPAINHRNGFLFQPYWIDMNRIQVKYSSVDNTRAYVVGYKDKKYNNGIGDLLTKSSNDGYLSCIDAYIPQNLWNDINKNITISVSDYTDYNFLIVCSNDTEIQRGIIPDIRNMVYNGTVPLLWHSHYMMHGLFKHLVLNTYRDLRYYCEMYNIIGNVFMEDIVNNISTYMPEMIQDNFIQTLLNIFEKM